MNVQLPITTSTVVDMSEDGEIVVPASVRRAAGLMSGGPVVVGINDRGEAVIRSRMQDKRAGETRQSRRVRIRSALDAITGKFSTGQGTGEVMRELRGDAET